MLIALLLTVIAGAATVAGAAMAVARAEPSPRLFGAALAAGAMVMLGIAVLGIGLPEIRASGSALPVLVGSAIGFAVVWALGLLVRKIRPVPSERTGETRAHHSGIVVALALAAHNIPEGFVTFTTALEDPYLALPIVAAIALHNIPEGMVVALPIHRATGSRTKALAAATASGMSEPLGALALYVVLGSIVSPGAMGYLNGALAGVMIGIAVLELLPLAVAQGSRRRVLG